MGEIGAHVVEISSANIRSAREGILASDLVWHVAQLGTRLHALIDPVVADPVAKIAELLGDEETELRLIDANLEDVFVMATASRTS